MKYPEHPGHVAGSDTSLEAAISMDGEPRAKQTAVVRNTLARFPEGLTRDEIEVITGLLTASATARVAEMKRLGEVVDTGKRRPTRTGRTAAVVTLASPS